MGEAMTNKVDEAAAFETWWQSTDAPAWAAERSPIDYARAAFAAGRAQGREVVPVTFNQQAERFIEDVGEWSRAVMQSLYAQAKAEGREEQRRADLAVVERIKADHAGESCPVITTCDEVAKRITEAEAGGTWLQSARESDTECLEKARSALGRLWRESDDAYAIRDALARFEKLLRSNQK
jgi:hypothetical protein